MAEGFLPGGSRQELVEVALLEVVVEVEEVLEVEARVLEEHQGLLFHWPMEQRRLELC